MMIVERFFDGCGRSFRLLFSGQENKPIIFLNKVMIKSKLSKRYNINENLEQLFYVQIIFRPVRMRGG